MQSLKTSFWSGLSVAIRFLGSFLVTKIVSVYYGPSGLSLFSQFQSLIGIFISIPVDGINSGVIRYLSPTNVVYEERRKIFSTAIFLSSIWVCFSCGIILLIRQEIFKVFPFPQNYHNWYILVIVALILQIISNLFLSVLIASQKLQLYSIASILNFSSPIIILLSTSSHYSFKSTLLIWVFFSATGTIVSAIYVYKRGLLKLIKPEYSSINKIGSFIIMALTLLLFGKVTDFVIRQYIITNYTAHLAGLWQSVVKLSEYYTGGLVALIGVMYFPQITRLLDNQEALQKYVRKVLMVFTPLILIGLAILYFLRVFFLELFFDKEFIQASLLLKFILLGDMFKLVTYFPAYLITAQSKTKLFILTEGFSASIFICCSLVFTQTMGIEGVTLAHLVRSFAYFVLVFYLYRKLIF